MRLPNRPRILPFLSLVKLLLTLVLVLLFIQFNARIAQNTITTKQVAGNTNVIVSKLKKVLCEDIPEKDCNLSKAVDDLKADNIRQDRYFSCILAAIGKPDIARSEITAQCEQVNASKTGSASQTGGSAASNPSPSKAPTSQSSSASAPATPQSSSSVSSSGNSSTQTQPSQPDNSLGGRIMRVLNDINPFN